MSLLTSMLICQLLVIGIGGSDRRLKENPKTEQIIVINDDNTTENAASFAPPHADRRQLSAGQDECEGTQDGTMYCSDITEEGVDVGPDTVIVFANRFNNSGEPVTNVSRSEIHSITSTDEIIGESNDNLVNGKTTKDISDTTRIDSIDDVFANTHDTESNGNDNRLTENERSEISTEMEPANRIETRLAYRSQLDPRVADTSIYDLRASVYRRLGQSLETANSHDNLDPWWKYIIVNDHILGMSWRDLRDIENGPTPGVDFLDALGERGYTLRDIEDLFVRHQIHNALNLLRFHQPDTLISPRAAHSVSEHKPGQERKQDSLQDEIRVDTGSEIDESKNPPLKENAPVDPNDMTTQEKWQSYDDHEYCSSNPCRNEGTCIEDVDGYSCKCAYDWYSGKDCEKDDGPCNTNCFKQGTMSCTYNGPRGTVTKCNCNVGYDGSECETEHDYMNNPCLRNLINSCNEQRLTQDECMLDAFGVDKQVKSLPELLTLIDRGEVKLPSMIDNLRIKVSSECEQELPDIIISVLSTINGQQLPANILKVFGLSTLANLFGNKVSSDSGEQRPTNGLTDVLNIINDIDIDSFADSVKTLIGVKERELRQQHQHSSDSDVEEVAKRMQKMYADVLK